MCYDLPAAVQGRSVAVGPVTCKAVSGTDSRYTEATTSNNGFFSLAFNNGR